MALVVHPAVWLGLVAVGAVGGLALVESERQKKAAIQRKRHAEAAANARLVVVTAANGIADMLNRPRPQIFFDQCANAETNTDWICVSTNWAVRELASSCNDSVCVRDRIFGTLSHEFGHILDPHVGTRTHPWHDELAADYAAGWIMRRLGLNPAHFVDALATFPGADTHPPGHMRSPKVWEGYNNEGGFQFNWC